MGIHHASVRTTNITTGQALCEIIGSSTRKTVVLEIGIRVATVTTGHQIGLGRPAAVGITPAGLVTVTGEDENEVGETQIATSWGTSPTEPSPYMRRWSFPATTAQTGALVWHFPQGITLATSGVGRSLVVMNFVGVAASGFDISVTVEED